MSIETYEKLVGKYELYKLLDEGVDAAEKGRTVPASEAFDRVFQKLDKHQ